MSLPFGDASFQPKNMGYLTAEQALADYALLIESLKEEYDITKVISFGGRQVNQNMSLFFPNNYV